MSSVDARIRREAKRYNEEINAVHKRRLERLRELLDDEVYNMLERVRGVTKVKKTQEGAGVCADWIHNKHFDDTYRDYGHRSKRMRTRTRFESLLKLCGGDRNLLSEEYNRSLNKYIPIAPKRYEWGARLVTASDGQVTMYHSWKRTPKAA